MNEKIMKFDDARIEEYEFRQYKSPILISDIDINKIIKSHKISCGKQDFKYFIGYNDFLKN